MISFIKNHKLALVLLIVLLVVLFTKANPTITGGKVPVSLSSRQDFAQKIALPMGNSDSMGVPAPNEFESTPVTDVANRMVVSESQMSILVANVQEARKKILDHVQNIGGYMVNSSVSNIQENPTSTVTVRLPSVNLETVLVYFRSLGVKVVSENLQGYDVTDQYVDLHKRIAINEKTKAKFEEILSRAQEISDITNLNQQIINIQAQIDSLKGEKDYLAKNAEMAKLTVYLSTDELALPYAPSQIFRPAVIFKQAIRSLMGMARVLVVFAIWLGVYSVIWVPAIFIIRFVYRKIKTNRGA
jgi:hypothetical protein